MMTIARVLPVLSQAARTWPLPGEFRCRHRSIKMPLTQRRWECRGVEDVLEMLAYLRLEGAMFGWASIEAVYAPGMEWLSMLVATALA